MNAPPGKKTAVARAADMQFIKPLSVAMQLRGVDMEISPLRVGEFEAFAAAVAPVVDWIPQLVQVEADPGLVLQLLKDHGGHALAAVAVASRQPIAWVRELMLDELVELATVCLEVNADFFRRALPAIEQSGTRLRATFSAGQKPSSS